MSCKIRIHVSGTYFGDQFARMRADMPRLTTFSLASSTLVAVLLLTKEQNNNTWQFRGDDTEENTTNGMAHLPDSVNEVLMQAYAVKAREDTFSVACECSSCYTTTRIAWFAVSLLVGGT